jgi:hypothetical protein
MILKYTTKNTYNFRKEALYQNVFQTLYPMFYTETLSHLAIIFLE